MSRLNAQLDKIEARFTEIERLLAEPEVLADYSRMSELAQERSEIEELVEAYRRSKEVDKQLAENRLLMDDSDPEMAELAELEIESLEAEYDELEQRMKQLLLPKDPKDDKNVIVEIRAGTGGEEAGLFAAELYRMYLRWAENHRFKSEELSMSETGIGGLKEVIFAVKGKGAYSRLKYESGVHRVQRVPATESQGRIHTSAATVAVLPEADDVEVEINENDIQISVFRSSGPGGQSVNTTDSAVRLVHTPTGLVIECQDERSQLQNKLKAMRILRTKLYDLELQRQRDELDATRKSQVRSGDRSEKIRTYNFPQNRVTDHRINLTIYQLDAVMNGELDQFIEELGQFDQAERLQALA
ncbi:MAG: peptide chain release factor 1, partial [Caldilineaceae bacterium]|nr:peptide chain release factor 1 [Caldilineaceae bacterium]